MTTIDSFKLSSEIWTILAVFLATVLTHRIWSQHKFKLPPLINPGRILDLTGTAVKKDFVQRSNELIEEGSKAFGEQPYSIMSDTGRVIMLAPKHADEIRNDPKLSFLKNLEHVSKNICQCGVEEILIRIIQDFHAYLPGFEPFGANRAFQILIMVAKKQLTKFLGRPMLCHPVLCVELASELVNSEDHQTTL